MGATSRVTRLLLAAGMIAAGAAAMGISKANADDFYWDKYLARRGTKGISE